MIKSLFSIAVKILSFAINFVVGTFKKFFSVFKL